MPSQSAHSSHAYPCQPSSNRRYLVDQNGRPFLVHGDTAWSIIAALDEQQVEHYLVNRAEKGFNALIVNLVEHKFNGPLNPHGEHPFTDPLDLGTPNDRYFEYADWVLRRAGEHGFTVFLAPLYPGYKNKADDEGWYYETRRSGMQRCYHYGRYLGQRYAGYRNLVWMIGGDRNPEGVVDEFNSLIQGIKDFDMHSLFTAHPAPEFATSDTYGRGGWLDLCGTYSYQIVHKKLLADYNRRPTMPFVLMESTYEGEHNASPLQIRRQAYWALTCGACGQFFGNRPIWLFDPGWEAALESQGSRHMVYVKRLFASRPWYDLVPDQAHQVVTGGLGEFNGLDTLTAARTRAGETVIAYLPSARTVRVDLAQIAGECAIGWWFNPRNGAAETAGEFSTHSPADLDPPGEGDWVLVLDSAEAGLGAPGE